MAERLQCDNCGAILLREDQFCGECGAPRPAPPEAVEPSPAPEPKRPPSVPPVPPSTQPNSSAEVRWRVASIVLLVLGVLACLAGLIAFALVGSIGGETTTVEEDWLFSAFCCLLPIGGTGAILAAVGAVIWYTRLKRR